MKYGNSKSSDHKVPMTEKDKSSSKVASAVNSCKSKQHTGKSKGTPGHGK